MPILNWVKKDLEKDLIITEESDLNTPRLLEINNNPTIEKYDFETKPIIRREYPLSANLDLSKKWHNMLFWGDNIDVMKHLLRDFTNGIDLIYIDPPFATGSNFKYKVLIGEESSSEISEAYSDSWSGGIDEYITFIHNRLKLMKQLLSQTGSIYVHLDWHISHYIKVLMDELFGKENFRNEIIWAYPAASAKTRRFFIRSYDSILFYTKSEDYVFNNDPKIYMEYSNRVKDNLKKDKQGTFYYRGGSHGGKKLSQKVYIQEEGIFPRDVWNDIPYVRANTIEYQGFSTQKPERLLKRIILASTNPRGVVADFFCGTGTTLCVAEKLGRKWIGSDNMKNSIDISKKRILSIYNSNNLYHWKKKYKLKPKPFELYGLNTNVSYFKIPDQFLEGETKKEVEIKNSESHFTVSIIVKDKLVNIQLVDYSLSNNFKINEKLTPKIKDATDLIDAWAVDYNFNKAIFNTSWISFRTLDQRNLKFQSKPYLFKDKGEYDIAVKVVNIFRGESIQSYKIII